MDNVLRPFDLTTPQYAVLCAIEAEPGMSNARLARAAFVTAQTMQGVLSNLEKHKLLRRRPDPSHGRILRSELTSHGQTILVQAHAAVHRVENKMVDSFGEGAAVKMAESLSRCAVDLMKTLESQTT